MTDLRHLLPKSLSDQEATKLVEFFYRLTESLDEIYYPHILRHYRDKTNDENKCGEERSFPTQNLSLDDDPF